MSETASIQFIGLRTENPLPRRRALAASSPLTGRVDASHRAAGFFGALAVCGRALRAGLSTGMEIVFCVRLGPISMAVFFYSRLCCEFVAIAKANAPQTLPRHGDRTLSASFLSLSIVALAF